MFIYEHFELLYYHYYRAAPVAMFNLPDAVSSVLGRNHQKMDASFSFLKEEINVPRVEGDLWIKCTIPGMETCLPRDVDGKVMLNNYFDTDTGQFITQYVLSIDQCTYIQHINVLI